MGIAQRDPDTSSINTGSQATLAVYSGIGRIRRRDPGGSRSIAIAGSRRKFAEILEGTIAGRQGERKGEERVQEGWKKRGRWGVNYRRDRSRATEAATAIVATVCGPEIV